ncbi:auxin-induced protein PCNT115 [Chytridium lagenaria]|nr:auxin-induced protein PCNT115 [Chytridium lagenaria]
MAKRELGRGGPLVASLGLGAMGMSEFYGPADEEESIKTLNRSIDLGCTFIDTADMYGNGENEKLLAKILKTRRSEVFLCTKFGVVRDETGKFTGVGGSPEYVKKACQRSLERLGIDCIDLYYQHRVDVNTPIEETVKAMADLVKEGKVKYIGLSEASAQTIRRAHAVHPISAVQVEYSPWTIDIETNGILDTCRELGIAIVAYSPLGRGFLTGQYKSPDDFAADDYRKYNPRFVGENFKKNLALVDALENIAKAKGVTVTQLTLAWVAAQDPLIIAIPGTKKVTRLEENWASTKITITDEDNAAIRAIINSIPVAGDRYPEQGMKMVNI